MKSKVAAKKWLWSFVAQWKKINKDNSDEHTHELFLLKFSAIITPFLSCHLGFHIFWQQSSWGLHIFLQLGCFGLDIGNFN